MDKKHLFRPEVLAKKLNTNYGTVSINLPPSIHNIAWIFLLAVVAILSFICTAQIAEVYSVPGYLNSDLGTVAIYPNKNGIIREVKVKQGEQIKKGDILFVIDTSTQAAAKEQDREIIQNLNNRKADIVKQLHIKTVQMQSLKNLLDKQYISVSEYNRTLEALYELRIKKNNLELEIINHSRENAYALRSPVDGVITSLLFNAGQAVNATKPLAQLIPKNSKLIVELYIPVAKSGFINKGQTALIQYDAYPHSRFGSYFATIQEVGETILTDEDQDKPIKISMPYYRVKAELKQSTVLAYGIEKKLQQGMTLTARIVGPKRKIWQWILDPIYSFYGNTFV